MKALSFNIPDQFLPFVESALARLSYLYPAAVWSFDELAQNVTANCAGETIDASMLRKELYFQLYREKIQADTNGIRRRLYEATGK